VPAVDEKPLTLLNTAARRERSLAVAMAWGPVLAWMAVIVSLSGDQFADVNTASWLANMPWVEALGLSPAAIAAANLIVRKCAHFVEYAVLGGLNLRAAQMTWPKRSVYELMAFALGVAVLHAGADELRQYLATNLRTGTVRDIILDAAGGLAGAALAARYLWHHRARK
jgi:VanZ family protein